MLSVFKWLQTNKQTNKKEAMVILVPKCLVWHMMQGLNCRFQCQKLRLNTRMWWAGLRLAFGRSVYIFPRASLTRTQALNLLPTRFDWLTSLFCVVDCHRTDTHPYFPFPVNCLVSSKRKFNSKSSSNSKLWFCHSSWHIITQKRLIFEYFQN